ncbi:MAG: serine hydrolase [Flammeovirgaceae bacterium]
MKNIFLTLFILLFIFSCNQTKHYDSLEERIVRLINSEKGEFAVAYKNLNTGETILINENEEFHAASTMKTPVMIEVYKKDTEGVISLDDSILIKNEFRSIYDGTVFKLSSFDDSDKKSYEKIGSYLTLRELVYDMITISSNFATNLVIDYIGSKEINNTMRSLGAKNINVLRGVEDIKAFDKGMNNTTTALDLLFIYEKLARGEIISLEKSEEMVDILKNQKYDDIIPKYLPKSVKVAHKDGWIDGVRHDSGIIYTSNNQKYVLVLLSKNLEDDIKGADMLAKLSLEIYNSLI